jgi:DNA-binding NtrC family response regulator
MNPTQGILVIDDEEIVRKSLASWLEEDGYEVDTAPDGPSGLAKLRAKSYLALLVDLKMPGMDGLEVLAKAREMQPEVPCIIMTAYATVDTAVQAMKHGAYDYLVKPFELEELSLMVGKLVGAQALGRENVPERPTALSRGPVVTSPEGGLAAATTPGAPESVPNGAGAESLRDAERKHIVGILKHHHWNISRTAKALGIDRVTLYNKIKRYQIREAE